MGSSEHINEASDSIPHSEFMGKLRNYSFLKKVLLHGVILFYIICSLFIGLFHTSHYKAFNDKMTSKE
jgi:hypothetical protein